MTIVMAPASPLRIRFVAAQGLIPGLIRAAQLGFPYAHAEVETPEGYLGAHADGGVALRPVGYDAGDGATEMFATLAVAAPVAEAFHAYLRAQIGKPYDFAAIADFALAVVRHPARPDGADRAGQWLEPRRWFCSELVAAALVHAGAFDRALAAHVRHVTPQNLAFALSAIADMTPPTAVGPAPRAQKDIDP